MQDGRSRLVETSGSDGAGGGALVQIARVEEGLPQEAHDADETGRELASHLAHPGNTIAVGKAAQREVHRHGRADDAFRIGAAHQDDGGLSAQDARVGSQMDGEDSCVAPPRHFDLGGRRGIRRAGIRAKGHRRVPVGSPSRRRRRSLRERVDEARMDAQTAHLDDLRTWRHG